MASSLELPKLRTSADLRPATRYGGVPRRYDETKPVVVQGFTHRKILDLGTMIHRKTIERCILEKEVAVQNAEALVWIQAEQIQEEALEKAAKKAKAEHEQIVTRMERAHDRALLEEAIRVESEMQKLAVEEVQKERREGEQKLAEAVAKTADRCAKELEEAVAKARAEEREAAARQTAQVRGEEQERLEMALQKCAQDKASALEKLKLSLLKKAKEQVERAHTEEQKIASEKLARMKSSYDQQVTILTTKIDETKKEVLQAQQHEDDTNKQIEKLKKELIEIKADFADFIKRVKPYNETEPDFIVPPQLSQNGFDPS